MFKINLRQNTNFVQTMYIKIHRVLLIWTISIDSLHHFTVWKSHNTREKMSPNIYSCNNCKFQWFWRDHCRFPMVFEETITIECFLTVWPLPSMVFRCFFIFLPSLSMVFDGSGPLVKRCDGFGGSFRSICHVFVWAISIQLDMLVFCRQGCLSHRYFCYL